MLGGQNRSVTIMGMNKAQKQAAARAKETTLEVQPPVAVVEQPKQLAPTTPAPTPAQAAVSKQTQTIEKLKEGWLAKGVNLDKLTVKDDGKFKLAVVDEGWPTVQIGQSGGITVLELKSYAKAFDAAMIGKELFDKQKGREQKKATASAPAPKAEQTEKQAVTA
jgi:hypothetical protein